MYLVEWGMVNEVQATILIGEGFLCLQFGPKEIVPSDGNALMVLAFTVLLKALSGT
jgi:hypothetical protein